MRMRTGACLSCLETFALAVASVRLRTAASSIRDAPVRFGTTRRSAVARRRHAPPTSRRVRILDKPLSVDDNRFTRSDRPRTLDALACAPPAERSFFVPVIESKFVRKLIRRVQFASIVATNPWQGGAMYKLIKQPGAVDSVSLGGLAGSPLIERLKSSPLISTGNALVPVRAAENLYLKACWAGACALRRKRPGREAQMRAGWRSLFRGEVDRAMSIFSAAMDRQATKIQACRNLALCHYIQGDLDRAVETVRIGAAMSPKTSSLMTLFSRLVRDTHDIERFLDEKMRIARNGFTIGTAAQFIRACGRAGATEAGE